RESLFAPSAWRGTLLAGPRSLRALLAGAAVGAVVGGIAGKIAHKWYESSAQLAVIPIEDPTQPGNALEGASATLPMMAAVIQTGPAADEVIESLGLAQVYRTLTVPQSRAALWSHVVVTSDRRSGIVRITAEDADPKRARDRRESRRPRHALPPDPAAAQCRDASARPHQFDRRADRVPCPLASEPARAARHRRHRGVGARMAGRAGARASPRAATDTDVSSGTTSLTIRGNAMRMRLLAGLVALWPAIATAQQIGGAAPAAEARPGEAPLSLAGTIDAATYVLGPGDRLLVELWGLQEESREVEVNAEGRLLVPRIGMFAASGTTLASVHEELVLRMKSAYPRLNTNLTLSRPRTFTVYVVGAVVKPGSYRATP